MIIKQTGDDINRPRVGADLADIYRWLHQHPELSFEEHNTAAVAAAELAALGLDVHTGIGVTGVVGVLANGTGPTVLLRADMDALPIQERTGLSYASTTRSRSDDGLEIPVMHACGHDMHVACLIGAVRELVRQKSEWAGTLEVVFQPAEELGAGASAMVDDKLLEIIPAPSIVLGQHVAPVPAGVIGLQPGTAFAASDSILITFHGTSGHGSRPETTVDPIVMAAAAVLRLQSIVSRETAATDMLVLTIGTFHAGTKSNIIPDSAELRISLRSTDETVRQAAHTAIRRIADGESIAAGAPQPPTVEVYQSFPSVSNDAEAATRTRAALTRRFGDTNVVFPGAVTGSEDIGILATAAGAPCTFWLLGGADPAPFAAATSHEDLLRIVTQQPSNHSSLYAPLIQPTLTNGVDALCSAAREWFTQR